MPTLLDKIAHAFEDDGPRQTTLGDVSLLRSRVAAPAPPGAPPAPPLPGFGLAANGSLTAMRPGVVFVHERRPEEELPTFPGLPLTGIPTIDATFRKRSERLVQDMTRAFSDFSLAGHEWAEQRAHTEAQLAAERAAEDAAIARRRFEEDAALAAKRAQEDEGRSVHGNVANSSFATEREAQEAALHAQWRGRFDELRAALEEALAAHEAQKALEAQRKKEEQARVSEAAAREAAREAEHASRQTEAAEDARRIAELAKLRLAQEPSVRSLALVSAAHVAPALHYALADPTTPLRLVDRSWWKVLHLLEAEGLTPPLKATDVATSLFGALDSDGSGALSAIDAGYMLSLITSGTPRDRVDATCDAPGAPAGSSAVTQGAATLQLQHCAQVRKRCAPKVTALLLSVPAADATMMIPVPSADAIERAVHSLYATSGQLTAERFRSWAASQPTVAPLFVPLFRGS